MFYRAITKTKKERKSKIDKNKIDENSSAELVSIFFHESCINSKENIQHLPKWKAVIIISNPLWIELVGPDLNLAVR